jgi:dTDP-4-amino-4,6-dideoxygalactose transaminase
MNFRRPVFESPANEARHSVGKVDRRDVRAQTADGLKAGSMGTIACFNINALKAYHSYEEAGAVLCADAKLGEKMASLRYADIVNRENCHYLSLNFHLQALQVRPIAR